jgi:hypothetical protein
MTLANYAGFIAVTVIAIVLIMRSCFFLFVCKVDPMKAIVPSIGRWAHMFESGKKLNRKVAELS